MADSVVNGVKKELKGQADVIHLSLMSKVGRQAAGKFGVRIVPVTLLFDGHGNMIGRQAGMPDAKRLVEQLIEIGPVSEKLDQSEIYVNWR